MFTFLGLRLVEGGLRAKKLKIQQNRIQEFIARVNPVQSAVMRTPFQDHQAKVFSTLPKCPLAY